MLGLDGYGSGSDSEAEEDSPVQGPEPPEESGPSDPPEVQPNYCYAESSSDSDSEDENDSEAHPPVSTKPTEPTSEPTVAGFLPNPLDALDEAARPAFLDPAATKPMAVVRRAKPPPKAWEEKPPEEARAMMAEHRVKAAMSGATISASAVKYAHNDQSEGGGGQQKIDPLALAMLGESMGSSAAASVGPSAPTPGDSAAGKQPKKRAVLLGSGEKGEVKEREKKKRMMGQNGRDSVSWKSEEEMILRQQFDS